MEKEVWINPLRLPADITRETIRRRDGTIPADWFHLPEGANPPSVEELLKDDSPEPETATSSAAGRVNSAPSPPPLCGRLRSKSRERGQQKESGHKGSNLEENTDSAELLNAGYEPVTPKDSTVKGAIPVSRSPSSQLPSLPTHRDQPDNDVTTGCFSLRSRSRSKSKEKKIKGSGFESTPQIENLYETPKFPNKKDGSKKFKKKFSDMEDGYEPVGTNPFESWIDNKEKEYEDLEIEQGPTLEERIISDFNKSSIESQKTKHTNEHIVTIKEKETGKIIYREKLSSNIEKENSIHKVIPEEATKAQQLKLAKEEKKLRDKQVQEERITLEKEQKEKRKQEKLKKKEEKDLKEKNSREEKDEAGKKLQEEKKAKEKKTAEERDEKARRKEEKDLKERISREEKDEAAKKLQEEKRAKEKKIAEEKEEKVRQKMEKEQ